MAEIGKQAQAIIDLMATMRFNDAEVRRLRHEIEEKGHEMRKWNAGSPAPRRDGPLRGFRIDGAQPPRRNYRPMSPTSSSSSVSPGMKSDFRIVPPAGETGADRFVKKPEEQEEEHEGKGKQNAQDKSESRSGSRLPSM
ncbi:hypothetical protein ACLMJK_005316 [Lecanora helva]